MKKPNCNVTRRVQKKHIVDRAEKTIGNLIRRSRKFLQTICSDSGVCIALGRNSGEITEFFKGFVDFTYANSPIQSIGKSSVNGFIKELEYERQGYKSHAILKSAQRMGSDNLVYEYLVGVKYINRIMKIFPCFVQTYGLFYYDTPENWTKMEKADSSDKAVLQNLVLQHSIDYSKACEQSKYAAVLIQHIQNAITMNSIFRTSRYSTNVINNAIYLFFIIYQALSSVSKKFTHYDLHLENVLLFEPVKGKYIEYQYHNIDRSITSFRCPYIPKIIDYGRCFFDNGNINSRKIYDAICATPKCNQCGQNSGFKMLNPVKNTLLVDSAKKNESFDLRLLNNSSIRLSEVEAKLAPPTKNTYVELSKIAKKVEFGVGIHDKKNKIYGTKENVLPGGNKIVNVSDAHLALKAAIETPDLLAENYGRYQDVANKLGDLHVYYDGSPMKWTPI